MKRHLIVIISFYLCSYVTFILGTPTLAPAPAISPHADFSPVVSISQVPAGSPDISPAVSISQVPSGSPDISPAVSTSQVPTGSPDNADFSPAASISQVPSGSPDISPAVSISQVPTGSPDNADFSPAASMSQVPSGSPDISPAVSISQVPVESSDGPVASEPSTASPMRSPDHNNYFSFPPDSDSNNDISPFPTDAKLTEICDSTDHPELCIATVVPFLKHGGGMSQIDVQSVVKVSINATADFTKFVLSKVKNLADDTNPPELTAILNDCKDSYDTASYSYENAISAFDEDDIGTVNSMLSAVITVVGDCEDSFAGFGMDSSLAQYSDKLTNMTSNCLALVSIIDQN